MTIKQNGGIFGRNPTFNDVTVEGEFTSSGLNIDSNKLYVDPNNVRVGINTDSPDTIFEIRGPDPILTIRDTDTGSATANATLRLAETGASDTLDAYWDIKATNGFLHFIDNWNEGGGTGTRISFLDGGGIAFNGDTAQANALDDYEEGVFGVTAAASSSGTVTLDYNTLAYVKIGRLVFVTGEIRVSAVSSPVGDITINSLPFTNSGLSQRSSRTSFFVEANSLTGSPTGIIQGNIAAGGTAISIRLVNNFSFISLASYLQANSAFKFCFAYNAA